METDLKRFLDSACDAALAAGKQLRADFGGISCLYNKSERDPVTQADINAEKIILEILRQQFPQHTFLSEESGLQGAQTRFRWIIDPLDGTANFLHNLAHFGVSIALQIDGVTIVGVVYQPIVDELYTAIYGQGAYFNGAILRVSSVNNLEESLIGTGFSTDITMRSRQQVLMKRFLTQCGAIREQGSASLGLCNVARGIYDGYWELGLSLWDIAAGMLIVTEARGKATNLGAKMVNYQFEDILASNSHLYETLEKITLDN